MAQAPVIPIAVCGMGMRLPGGVEDAEGFWQLLMDKREARTPIPRDRFNVDGFYHPGSGDHGKSSGKPGSIVMQHGYFLAPTEACPDPVQAFDGSAFSMSRREIERLDPQQRLMLQVVRECFESAGVTGWRGSRIGCFTGTFGSDWGELQASDKQRAGGLYNVTGNGDFLLSNRISYEYDLKGPSFTVKTACSSSMLALHLACTALKNNECDGAIVGGANLIIAPLMSISMTDQGILSPEGRCKTFDASADGYGRGEAVNAVFLKRLDDAIRDGNPVRAVIRATGTNCDGKSQSLAAPSLEAHESLIRDTLDASGIDVAADVLSGPPFFECHGTGTAIGDPLEASAVSSVMAGAHTFIGSVKPNVGHSEGASGITSIIKCVLALERRTIPPNINFSKPNPRIPLGKDSLTVPVDALSWPEGRPERIGINSYGMGGANVHVIMDSAAQWDASVNGLHSRRNGINGVNGHRYDASVNGTTLQNGTNGVNGHRHDASINDTTLRNGTNGVNGNSHDASVNGTTLRNGTNGVNGHSHDASVNGTTLQNGTNGVNGHRHNASISGKTLQNGTNGVNGHSHDHTTQETTQPRLPHLLVLSAYTPESLGGIVEKTQHYIQARATAPSSPPLHDIAYTLAQRREHLRCRAYAVVNESDEQVNFSRPSAIKQPTTLATQAAKVTFVFTGQGAQWAGMGRELLQACPSFAADIAQMDQILDEVSHKSSPRSWTIQSQLLATASTPGQRLQEAEVSQPVCTALQIALVNLWRKTGVEPDSVIGHSSGEIAAAYAAGALGMREAILVAYFRGRATATRRGRKSSTGAMAAIGLGSNDLTDILAENPGAVIACENSASSVTISGDRDAVQGVVDMVKLRWPDVLARFLRVDQAYHSHHMKDVGAEYEELLNPFLPTKKTSRNKTAVTMISTVTGDEVTPEDGLSSALYWRRNLESQVKFYPGMKQMLARMGAEGRVFLEIGPHGALVGPMRQILKEAAGSAGEDTSLVLTSLSRDQNSASSFLTAVGELFTRTKIPVDLAVLCDSTCSVTTRSKCPHPGRVVFDLPLYAWDLTERYWEESRVSHNWRMRSLIPHELLGTPVLEWDARQPSWRNIFRLEDVPWIRGHQVQGQIVFPAAAYIAMAGEAVRELVVLLGPEKKQIHANGTGVTTTHMGSGYRLRDVVIKNALVLRDGVEVELLTALSKARLTESLESEYYDFRISSCSADGSRWTEHCFGQVKLEEPVEDVAAAANDAGQVQQPFARQVSEDRWYDALSKVGLDYTGSFRRLHSITADPVGFSAGASVSPEGPSSRTDDFYPLHPATMDTFLQLLTVAAVKGEARLMTALSLPTFIDEICVRDTSTSAYGGSKPLQILVHADPSPDGSFVGSAEVTSFAESESGAKQCTFQMKGLRTRRLDAADDAEASSALDDPHGAVQLHWKPHLEYTDPHTLMHPDTDMDKATMCCLEEFTILSALDMEDESLADSPITEDHMAKYHDWLVNTFMTSVRSDANELINNASQLARLSREARRHMREALFAKLQASPLAPCAVCIDSIRTNWRALVEGTVEPLALLMQDGNLSKVYDLLSSWNYAPFLELLGHMNPTLRVLEIGAGTGGMTANILPVLFGEGEGEGRGATYAGARLCSTYTYTDISAGFFAEARSRFAAYDGVIEYAVVDITKDPFPQLPGGTKERHYDLIIAANVLHATPSLQATLANVRKLLRPVGGRLLLQELCPVTRFANFIWGVLPGWWLGASDGRPLEPYVGTERWRRELKAAGFEVNACVFDGPTPFHVNASILASTVAPRPVVNGNGNGTCSRGIVNDHEQHADVALLYRGGEPSPRAKVLAEALMKAGLRLSWHALASEDDIVPIAVDTASRNVISLLDLDDGPFISKLDKTQFTQLMALLNRLQNTDHGLFWITHPSQMDCEDPEYAQVLGLARNVRSELAVEFVTVEVASLSVDSDKSCDGGVRFQGDISAVVDLYCRRFVHRKKDGASVTPQDDDMEFAVRDGAVHIPRFHWMSLKDEVAHTSQTIARAARPDTGADSTGAALQVKQKGILNTLHWAHRTIPKLAPDEIKISVRASGLNFKDVLVAMGIVDGSTLGYEAAGVVEQVGSDVSQFKVGDRAMVFASDCLASHIVSKEGLAARIPDGLSDVEAATMPVVYTTVIRSVVDLGRLSKGQSILIHSGAGGVGIAAIRISQMIGAEIFVTAGNAAKREWLSSTFNIPPSHVFDSRSSSFRQAVLQATGGRGVDLVLNSLSGELLHESWACVAPFGTMIEIGKRDLLGRGRLAMHPFLDNRSYQCVDMHQISLQRPDIARRMLDLMLQYYNDGHIHPIAPTKVFAAGEVESAFRYMQKGVHIGKVVVEMAPNAVDSLVPKHTGALVAAGGLEFRSDRAYLLTGGFGGLGTATARWMVSRGARHLAFISRRGRDPSNETFLAELQAMGCTALVVAGDVQDEKTVDNLLQQLSVPLAGVFHLAMMLRDNRLQDMTYEDWRAVQGPRVEGAWNLHHKLAAVKLDFFLVYGSFSGLVGFWGQANYSATNTFLDAFAQYRQRRGLPTATLDIGVVGEVGYVSQNRQVLDYFKSVDTLMLTEQAFLDGVELAILRCLSSGATATQPLQKPDSASHRGFTAPTNFGIGLGTRKPLDDPTNRLIWKNDSRFSIACNIFRNTQAIQASTAHSDNAANESAILRSRAKTDPQLLDQPSFVESLAKGIGRKVLDFLLRAADELDLNRSMAEIGVDSLVAIEIRNWCRQHLGLEMTSLKIMNSTFLDLASFTAASWKTESSAHQSVDGEHVNGRISAEERRKWEEILQVKAP